MNHTLDDLRSTLDAAARDGYAPTDRVAGVRGVLARRRRQRALASGAAGLALVLGAGVALGQLPGTTGSSPVAPAASTPAVGPAVAEPVELPQFYRGGELVAEVRGDTRIGSVAALTFAPTSYDLQLLTECATPGGTEAWYSISIEGGGTVSTGGGCGSSTRASFGDGARYWQELGLTVGEPVTIRLEVLRAPSAGALEGTVDTDDADVPLLLGVYADVPLAEYPFPEPPLTTNIPADISLGQAEEELRPTSRDADGLERVTTTVAYDPAGTGFSVGAVAPGSVQVLVDGLLYTEVRFFEYGPSYTGAGLDPMGFEIARIAEPEPGQVLTVTFVGDLTNAAQWVAGFDARS